MKKTRLALVLAAGTVCASTAGAQQSNVTVYGRIDLGVRYAPVDLAASEDRQTTIANSSTARIGFRGEEDLGGGRSAYFQLEHRFKADTGAVDDPNAFWKDKAWVGLASRTLGKVQLGRQSSPIDNLGVNGRFEAFGGDSLGSMGGRIARAAAKWDNSVYYTTPNLAGFSFGLAASLGESATRRDAAGFHLDYAQGRVLLATSYQVEQDATVANARDSMRTASLAGSYDFGFARPLFTAARTVDLGPAAGGEVGERSVYTVGVRIPAGPGEVRVSYRVQDDDRANGSTFAGDRDGERLGIGYQYLLSKRTSLNLSAITERVETQTAAGAARTRFSGQGFEVALRHAF
ncbi:porin [Caldimonas tepidiphila]|uniref:porin n=1 Tax=Caldimonas tepidiphila TaxID=2315841 RepID=UPI000E5B0570|nr:porin [Caldimonas tepidiphila]